MLLAHQYESAPNMVAPRRRLSSPSGLSRHTLPASLLRRPRGSRRRDVVRVGGRRRGDEGAPRGGRRAANAPRGPSRRGDDGDAHRFRARLTTIRAPSRPPRPLAGDVLRVLRHPPRARRRRPSAPGPRGVHVREPPLVRPPHHPPRPRRVVSRARTFTSSPLSSSFAASDASSSVSLPPPRRAHPPRPPHATRPHPDRTPAPAPCS